MNLILLGIFFLTQILFNFNQAAIKPSDVYENSVILVKPDVYYLFWNYTSDSIIAEVQVKTVGWISFGITGNGNLDRSDLFIGWINSDKSFRFADCYIKNNNIFVDRLQNWIVLNSSQSSGYTMFKFTRKLYLCDVDPWEDLNIDSGTPYVSYSWGDDDPNKVINYFNTNANVQPVPLINVRKKTTKSETISTQIFITNSTNPVLPTDASIIYKCFSFNLNFTTKTHLIKFETVLDTSNQNNVYDWVMYECPNGLNNTLLENIRNLTCGLSDNNDWVNVLNNVCNRVVILWTNGNFMEQEFPATVGYPFSGSSVFLIRIRYGNFNLKAGINDNLSIKFTFTTDLRTNDAGTLSVGVRNSITGLILPPGANELTINSYCLSGCVDNLLPTFTYLNIFASVPHTYESGTQVYTRLIRAGSEYSYVTRNKYYNNSYQYSIFSQSPVILKQGDQLITTCKYSTSLDTEFTFGPDQETCMNVLYYYPRLSNISYCYTQPTVDEWINLLLYINSTGAIYEKNLLINQTNLDLNLPVTERIISQIKVTNQIRNTFQSFYDTAALTQFCGFNNTATRIAQLKVASTLTDNPQCALINNSIKNKINNSILFSFLLLKILLFLYISQLIK